jgi:hypothetical protein
MVSRDIAEYLDSLETGPHYTSPENRLKAARQQFDDLIERALRDDATALDRLISAAETLKANVAAYYASSAEGARIIKDIKVKLRLVAQRQKGSAATKKERVTRYILANRSELAAMNSQNQRAKAVAAACVPFGVTTARMVLSRESL